MDITVKIGAQKMLRKISKIGSAKLINYNPPGTSHDQVMLIVGFFVLCIYVMKVLLLSLTIK